MKKAFNVAVLGVLIVYWEPGFAQSCPPTSVPPTYERQVAFKDISTAIYSGDWKYALQLAKDYARQYLSDCRNAPEIISAINRIGGKIQMIANDPSKTEEQKRTAIYKMIDDSMLPYQLIPDPVRTPINQLNASFRYSLEFGIARVSFDVETRDDMCEFSYNVNWGCTTDMVDGRYLCYNPGYGITYIQSRHRRTPNIYVFRQVDGFPEEQVAKFDGVTVGGRTGYYLGEALRYPDVQWQSVQRAAWSQLASRYNGTPSSPVTRNSIDLPTSPYLQRGRRVAYRLAAEWPAWNYPNGRACAQTFVSHTLMYVDLDGDGKVDIIPAAEYARHFGVLNAPAFATLLND